MGNPITVGKLLELDKLSRGFPPVKIKPRLVERAVHNHAVETVYYLRGLVRDAATKLPELAEKREELQIQFGIGAFGVAGPLMDKLSHTEQEFGNIFGPRSVTRLCLARASFLPIHKPADLAGALVVTGLHRLYGDDTMSFPDPPVQVGVGESAMEDPEKYIEATFNKIESWTRGGYDTRQGVLSHARQLLRDIGVPCRLKAVTYTTIEHRAMYCQEYEAEVIHVRDVNVKLLDR